MAVIGKLSADGLVQVRCPGPECGAALRIKPKSARSSVTCAKCGHKFALEVSNFSKPTTTTDEPWPDGEFDFVSEPEENDEEPRPRSGSTRKREEQPKKIAPLSGRYQSSKAPSSKKGILLIVGGGVAVLIVGFGLMAALGAFSSGSQDPPRTPGKDKDIAAVATTTRGREVPPPKPKVEPEVTKPAPKLVVRPKVQPDPEPPPPEPKPEPKPEPPPAPKPKLDPEPAPPKPKGIVLKPKTIKPPEVMEDEPDQKLKEILTRTKRATPLVEGKGGAGSGFVIRPGILVTNSHVIEREILDDIKVRFVSLTDTDPKPIKPVLLYEDRIRDLAIFRLDSANSPLDLCEGETELEGLRVAVVGNPAQAIGALKIGEVTYGALKAPARLDDGQIFYQLDAFAAPGNSGGPVIDQKTGKVVGVLTAGVRGRATTWCIPFTDVARALSRLPAADKEAAGAKLAAARHYVDYVGARLPEIEENAAMAMELQRLNLRGEEVLFRKGEKIYRLPEVMKELKDDHAKIFQTLSKLVQTHVTPNKDLPDSLRQVVRARVDACNTMRLFADSKPMTEGAFIKAMEQRKTASENSVKAFDAETKKYREQLEQKYNAPPK